MVCMEQGEYIKKYCDNKYKVWLEKSKNFPHRLEQVAFYDISTWIDEEHGIEIESRFYIGD